MRTTDQQVRRLMEAMSRHGKVGRAAMVSAMDRKTARKYIEAGRLPSELEKPRTWRTRADPFEAEWPALVARLTAAPTLEAKTLFEELLAEHPDAYHPGQLRTLQRRIREWRARSG
ncbi:MAG: IS21 family transposase, partial [Dehalococcoidia bacterium]|nr:IS21 family transposase [Dehalococcoidia bacterium]